MKQFPMIVNHPEITYLDSAATALTPNCVIDAIVHYYTHKNTNISRGVDKLLYETTLSYEAVRSKTASFINAGLKEEIIFTRGTTTSLNLIAFGLADKLITEGDELILNIGEHHANLLPWQIVAQRKNAIIKYVNLDQNGSINYTHLQELLSDKTKVVSFAHVTNVLGSYNDPQAITKIIRQYAKNAFIIVDGAQAIVQQKVDVMAYDCDFYVFSGHKLFGPTGVGVLYGKMHMLEKMSPFEYGGDMNDSVTKQSSEFKQVPHKFEAGTMMIAEVLGLGAAIDFIEEINYNDKKVHIRKLRDFTITELKKQSNIILYNEENKDSTTISFNLKDVHAHDAATVFSNESVVIRAGHHCAQLLLEKLETTSSLRASISIYTTEADMKKFIEVCKKASDFLDVLF
ncbi:MAG: aminotransferase class V-fold PLP-dependent enzyme [Culicoidibacterales bacterium]